MDYEEILKLLENAKGRSEHVIAINLDIRGFTPFCERETPLDVATYITKIYNKIIKNYFNNALFYKLTGDGLIIIIPFTEGKLKEVTRQTVKSCLDLIEDFATLCDDEPMVNFTTPDKIGIGLTRGSACCIFSKDEDEILDYSGRILNLASRLMDMARPSGIVFDESFGINLLTDETQGQFSEDEVHVRGIAEKTPIKVFYTSKHTLIPDSYHYPLKEPKWKTETYEYTFKQLKKLVRGPFTPSLKKKPLDESKITVRFTYENPKIEGFRRFYEFTTTNKSINYLTKGYKHVVQIDMHAFTKIFENDGVTDDMTIRIEIVYPIE